MFYKSREKMLEQIQSAISFANSVSYLHRKTFEKYKNIYQGRDVVLVATGPSLDKFHALPNAVYVGINSALFCENIDFDYIFCLNPSYQREKWSDEIKKQKIKNPQFKVFYGNHAYHSCCLVPESLALADNAEIFYARRIKNIEENFSYDILNNIIKEFGSSVFCAMQFILWTNPRRIFLVGCDCSDNGHSQKLIMQQFYSQEGTYIDIFTILRGWIQMKYFAHAFYPDTEIISINPIGLKGLFTDMWQDESGELVLLENQPVFLRPIGPTLLQDMHYFFQFYFTYLRYRFLAKITFGKKKNHYLEKEWKYKLRLEQVFEAKRFLG